MDRTDIKTLVITEDDLVKMGVIEPDETDRKEPAPES